jgi:mono/diheme cytochrome c family protein
MSHPNEGQDRLDYRESADITEVHASVLREHAEPRANSMPIPMWLGVLCAGALTWAGAYIGIFHGGFSGKVFNEYESSPAAFFPLKGGQQGGGTAAAEMPLLALGERVFGQNCVACHQSTGLGNAQYPPLAGSEWVEGAEFGDKRLVAILMKGIKGPITVKGTTFNGVMPNLGASLKPREVAAVLTFVRQAWGNKGTGEITEDQVKAAKKDALIADKVGEWSEAELKAIPTGITLGGAAAPVAAADGKAPTPGGAAATGQTAPSQPGAAPAADAGSFSLGDSMNRGKMVYMQTCMACHQLTGLGVPGAFPPLAGTEWVTGDSRRLVAITLKGIQGAMTIQGKVYATGMPSPVTAFPQLKDDKNLADVLNYARNSFGNKADVITPEFVGKVRAELAADAAPFTEETLKNFK